MNHLQALMDGMSAKWQGERAETQMTLGKMIKALEAMPETMKIKGLGELDSYRGYYEDLAFEPLEGERSVEEILVQCRAAMGQVFEGYKGGNFVMGALTPIWLAHYGDCGKKIIAICEDGTIETADDDEI